MRKFVLGDLHGGSKALMEVLAKSEFDYEEDKMILLGDLCDGWPQTRECIDELLKIKNLVFVRGNHDQWFIDWIQAGQPAERYPEIWYKQGGKATIDSYMHDDQHGTVRPIVTQEHIDFFKKSVYYHEEDHIVTEEGYTPGYLFVHGGVKLDLDIKVQAAIYNQDLMWDRELLRRAVRTHKNGKPQEYKVGDQWYKYIFVGHTSTTFFGLHLPQAFGNIVAMDTGGGWEGKLSIAEFGLGDDGRELRVWQSDWVENFYPGHRPRG